MKKIIKKLLDASGYVLMTKKRFSKIEDGPYIPDLDFIYLVKNTVDFQAQVCCIDIGANIGQTSLKLNKYFPNAVIHSFEPVKQTFDSLKKNTAAIPAIHCYHEAMGKTPGETVLYHRSNSEWNSLVKELNEEAKTTGADAETVKINSVDNFVADYALKNIAVLKSDTEGFEMQVLEGAKKSLADEIIDMIYIEVGFGKEDKQHTYWMDVVNYLQSYKYSFCGLFESSYGYDLKVYYANALFMSERKLLANKFKNEINRDI